MRKILKYAWFVLLRWLRIVLRVPSPSAGKPTTPKSWNGDITYLSDLHEIPMTGTVTVTGDMPLDDFWALPDEVTFEIDVDGLNTQEELAARLTDEPIGYVLGYPVFFVRETANELALRILAERAGDGARSH